MSQSMASKRLFDYTVAYCHIRNIRHGSKMFADHTGDNG